MSISSSDSPVSGRPHSACNRLLLWLRVIRPQTLFASVCPVLAGWHAATERPLSTALVTLCCALSLQILSNLINDWYDFERGTDQAGRAGFRRALAEGEITPEQMRCAICITLAITLLLGLWLVLKGGWIILGIGLTALLFAWLYTATRHSLSYLGIADIFVFLYYGVIASAGTTYLLDGRFSRMSLLSGAACGLISMCVLIINNLRDMASDRAAGKRTFPVRFGKKAGEAGMLAVILLIPVCLWPAFGLCLPMLAVVPALMLYRRVRKAAGAGYNPCLMAAGVINLCYTLLLLLTTTPAA